MAQGTTRTAKPTTTAVALLRASHFPPTIAVVALATGLAALNHRSVPGCAAVAAAVLAGQLSTGWSNDWLDATRDAHVGRTDKPIVSGAVSARTVGTAAIIAVLAAVPLSMLSGWRAATVHLVALASAWSYNVGLKSTILSPLPYGVSFGLLPAFVTLGPPTGTWPRPGLMVAAGLLGIGAHFINTLADRSDDARTGVRGLPQRLPPTSVLTVGVLLLAGCAGAIWSLSSGPRGVGVVLLVACLVVDLGVVVSARVGSGRLAWRLTLVSVGCCLLLFAAAPPSLV